VLVFVGIIVALGGSAVSVGSGWVGVDDGSGGGSVVISGVGSITSDADSVGVLALQPEMISTKRRKM
jgi:hypothetical protein